MSARREQELSADICPPTPTRFKVAFGFCIFCTVVAVLATVFAALCIVALGSLPKTPSDTSDVSPAGQLAIATVAIFGIFLFPVTVAAAFGGGICALTGIILAVAVAVAKHPVDRWIRTASWAFFGTCCFQPLLFALVLFISGRI